MERKIVLKKTMLPDNQILTFIFAYLHVVVGYGRLWGRP